MADDGKIVIGIEGNPAGLNKALDDVEKKGQKTAQSVGSAFSAIGGALAGAGVIASFKGAFDAANRLEASLARVTSSAKAFGLSTESAKKAAIDLAKDGFLSLNQSASALSNLMSTGLNIDQSKKFIEASKNIAAFGNTVGDAAGSIESGIKGIITGSSELVENMSPAMKKLSMAFTENKNKVGEAKAIQELYNGVIKLGNQYAGDAAKYLDTASAAQNKFNAATEAASAAVGKSLQPMLKSLFNTLAGLVEGFTKWFSGLTEMSQTVITVGIGIAALIPIIAGLNSALSMLAVNPIVLMLTAAVLATTALAAAFASLEKSPKEIVRRFKETSAELDNLGNKVKELNAINKKTIAQELELIDSKEALRKKSKELGLDYDLLASKAKNYAEVVEKIKFASREKAAGDIDAQRRQNQQDREANELRIKAAEAAYGKSALGIIEGGGQFVSTPGFGTVDIRAALEARQQYESRGKTQDLERAQLFSEEQEAKKATGAQSGAKTVEQRFLDTQEKLKQIELNRIATIARAEGIKDENERKRRQERAYQDAEILAQTEINALRSAYAEFIEDKATADEIALDEQTNAAIRAIRQQEEAGEIIKEQAEKRIQKIREANARKAAEITIKSFSETAQAASAVTSGIGTTLNAKDIGSSLSGQGSILTGLSGFKNLAPALGALGPLGQGIGAIGGAISTFTGLFGKSEAERARDAEDKKRRDEEMLRILELQANYQKNMLALQEAAAKLPFENLTRDLRLIDINSQKQRLSGADEQTVEQSRLTSRQAALQSVLSSQSGAISGGQFFGGTGSTPDELIRFLSERAAQSVAIQQFVQLMGAFQGAFADGVEDPGFWDSIYSQIESYRGKVPDKFFDYLDPLLRSRTQYVAGFSGTENRGNFIRGLSSTFGGFSSEITSDTGIAENLLSVVEQSLQTQQEIEGHTKKTADNTSRLTNMRENNILDLAGGGIRGFGSFFRGAFNSVDSLINPRMPSLSTPSAISNSLSVASLTRSWQDRAADGIENLVKIQTEALRLLAEIAMNTDAQGQVSGSMTSAQLQDIMANIRSRIV